MPHDDINDDWRWHGQEFLSGAKLYWRSWHKTRSGWDHDHCEFCWVKFMDCDEVSDILRKGYTSEDQYHWVCATCASDFAARLKLELIGGPMQNTTK